MITHAIFLSGSTANGVWVCMFERRKDYTNLLRYDVSTIDFDTVERTLSLYDGLRYSPLLVTEFCGEMQGKFKVGLARLIMHVTRLALTWVGWPNGEKLASTCVQI